MQLHLGFRHHLENAVELVGINSSLRDPLTNQLQVAGDIQIAHLIRIFVARYGKEVGGGFEDDFKLLIGMIVGVADGTAQRTVVIIKIGALLIFEGIIIPYYIDKDRDDIRVGFI